MALSCQRWLPAAVTPFAKASRPAAAVTPCCQAAFAAVEAAAQSPRGLRTPCSYSGPAELARRPHFDATSPMGLTFGAGMLCLLVMGWRPPGGIKAFYRLGVNHQDFAWGWARLFVNGRRLSEPFGARRLGSRRVC